MSDKDCGPAIDGRPRRRRALIAGIALSVLLPCASVAQTQRPAQEPPRPPTMRLERQFSGPMQDTLIQRWRDPADGTVCYIYLPVEAPHSATTPRGTVQYGPNSIGSISCFASDRPAPARR